MNWIFLAPVITFICIILAILSSIIDYKGCYFLREGKELQKGELTAYPQKYTNK